MNRGRSTRSQDDGTGTMVCMDKEDISTNTNVTKFASEGELSIARDLPDQYAKMKCLQLILKEIIQKSLRFDAEQV
eukprot:11048005-Karenia_brevis.AAC.1